MSEEMFKRETAYQASLSIGKSMLRNGLITPSEYTQIEKFLLEKYRPIYGELFSHGR